MRICVSLYSLYSSMDIISWLAPTHLVVRHLYEPYIMSDNIVALISFMFTYLHLLFVRAGWLLYKLGLQPSHVALLYPFYKL